MTTCSDKVKPGADKTGAQGWVQAAGVADALRAISTEGPLSRALLMAARPLGGLRWSHVYEMVEFSAAVAAGAAGSADQCLILSRWLHAAEHNLEGVTLPQLPTRPSKETKKLGERCKRAATTHAQAAAKVAARLQKAQQRGGSTAGAKADELALHQRAACPFYITQQSGGGGGGDDPAAAATTQVPVPAGASLLAFAMGTHPRLGAASLVQQLDADALGCIAAVVRGNCSPPPSELLLLRRDAPRLLRWAHEERRQKELLQTKLSELRSELERAGRHEAAAKEAAVKQAQANAATLQVLQAEIEGEERRHAKQLKQFKNELEQAWQLKVNLAQNELKQLLKTLQADAKRDVADVRAERDAADQGAAEAWQKAAELEDQVETLRSQRVNGLLETVAAKDAKIKLLGARRTLNQRRIGDANLDRRRAQAPP